MLAAMAYHAGHPHHTKVYQVATSAENRLSELDLWEQRGLRLLLCACISGFN